MNNEFILVNLLPYREKQKAIQIKKFIGLMIAFVLLGIMLVVIGHITLSMRIEVQESRNTFVVQENERLDKTIKDIANLKEEIKLTLEKRKVVEALQTNRADGVNIINELANNLPDDTYLQSIVKKGDKLTIVGQTISNNKVSHYMTALEESPVFSSPLLLEIKSVLLVADKNAKNKEETLMNQFTMTIEMQKTEEELKRIAEEKEEKAIKARKKK